MQLELTDEDVRIAMTKAKITRTPAEAKCQTCGDEYSYVRHGDVLFIDRDCECTKFIVPMCPVSWTAVSKYLNILVTVDPKQARIEAKNFGIQINVEGKV